MYAGLEKLFKRCRRGLGLGGLRGKGSLIVSKRPKPPIQLLQLLKNSPRERKRAYFRYILGPPGSHPGDGIIGSEGEGPSRSIPVSPAMPDGIVDRGHTLCMSPVNNSIFNEINIKDHAFRLSRPILSKWVLTMVRRLIKEDQWGHFRGGSHGDTGRCGNSVGSYLCFPH